MWGDFVSLLAEWIGKIAFDGNGFIGTGDTLLADRAIGIGRIAQTEVVGRDGNREPRCHCTGCAKTLRLGEPKHALEAIQVGNRVLRLPAPILPLGLVQTRGFAEIER